MYWLDTVILCVLAGGALVGALMGFLWMVFWIVAVSAGLYSSIVANDAATDFLQRHFLAGASPVTAHGAAYLVVFGLVFLVFLILTLMLHQLIRKARLQWLNRLLGSAFVALLLASALGLVLVLLHSYPGSRPLIEQSKIAPLLVAGIESLMARVPEHVTEPIKEKVSQTLQHQVEQQLAPTPQVDQKKPPALQIPLADRVIEEIGASKKK